MMSEQRTSGSAKALLKTITDIVTYVAALIAYLAAISGTAETPYPKTTALLIIVATSIVVVSWRWSQINRKKENASSGEPLTAGELQGSRQISLVERILDPLKKSSHEDYMLPLGRRRVEGGILFSLILLTVGWSVFNFSGALAEWGKNASLTCSFSDAQNKLRVVIADLLETGPQPRLLISDKIYESLVGLQQEGHYDVCRLAEPIRLSTLAIEAAKKYDADVVIWGRSDVIYEIHLEAPALNNPDRTISELSSVEASSVDFQFKEPAHVAYVTQFALGELLWLNGQTVEAQNRMFEVLSRAKRDGLDVAHPEDFADGYLLLGIIYHPGFSDYPSEQKAIEAYNNAIALNPNLYDARFNRGLILKDLGRTEEAMADFTFLIDNDTPLKGDAYVFRGISQSDPKAAVNDLTVAINFYPAEAYFYRGTVHLNQRDYQAAIEDFEQAVALDPEGFYNYHLLGQAQLYAGKTEAAKLTYQKMIPYLDEATREQVIFELQQDAINSPEIQPAVEDITQSLQSARLP